MDVITETLVPICICVVLPVLIVWLVTRVKTNRTNRNAEVIIKAIENNSTVDTERLIETLGKRERTPRELLNLRLLRGCIFSLIGVAFFVVGALFEDGEDMQGSFMAGGISLAIGIAYIIVFMVSRRQINDDTNS